MDSGPPLDGRERPQGTLAMDRKRILVLVAVAVLALTQTAAAALRCHPSVPAADCQTGCCESPGHHPAGVAQVQPTTPDDSCCEISAPKRPTQPLVAQSGIGLNGLSSADEYALGQEVPLASPVAASFHLLSSELVIATGHSLSPLNLRC